MSMSQGIQIPDIEELAELYRKAVSAGRLDLADDVEAAMLSLADMEAAMLRFDAAEAVLASNAMPQIQKLP
ncbi:MAG: hypothetical protein J0H39_21360 [Alphaproteobacteria bacterium]|nr:hypothetical protein [Alphaproteobacteria bacterium]